MRKRIVHLRETLDLSQAEFAESIGITQGALSQLETGKSQLSLTTLRKIHLSHKVDCNWLLTGVGEMFTQNDQIVISSNSGRISAQQLIPLVKEEAHAGYIKNCNDVEYLHTFDVYKIPGYENGDYRLFEVCGDSMLPTLHPREIVVAERMDADINKVENGALAVLVTEEGIVAKRTYVIEKGSNKLVLKSDNPDYKTYAIDFDSVMEAWLIRAKLTSIFAQDSLAYSSKLEQMESDIQSLKTQMDEVRSKDHKD